MNKTPYHSIIHLWYVQYHAHPYVLSIYYRIYSDSLRCDSLETEQLSRGVGSDDAVSPGQVAQGTGCQEIGQEHGEGKAVVDKERELPVHRLDTDVVSNWRERFRIIFPITLCLFTEVKSCNPV